ncbi:MULTISPECIES: dimethylmenaquinone methyltransferase [unclassified Methylobacterium]|uniref:RraA family protein n=1 Tax=unclassified Methylobacterium TaxID=2615210 RepID=UPI0011C2058C|nr:MULTISPECIES: dimethylmenaquinone methyltransferase [unclassified Methylobacterium]QEE39989.1 dimethylmenaquinone methyltransferase [Methylobacterium sp. WL1]TXN58652.1 dimethylmenaquinone methyltransferase [Methylobacterium sp. WL2]
MAIDPTLRDALSAVTPASLARALTRAGIKAFSPRGLTARGGSAIGPAYTLRMIPARNDAAGDLAAAIDAVPEGAVLVIDAAGSGLALPFGAIVAARLAQRGVAGLITDGALPDPTGLPVWSAQEAGSETLALVGAQERVSCGGAAIHPGDIVVCGSGGIVALPADLAERVALEAVEQQRLDLWIQREAERGENLASLLPPDAAALARFEAETKPA